MEARTLEMELKIRAIEFSVQYCAAHQNEDVIRIAEDIYQFIRNEKQEQEQ